MDDDPEDQEGGQGYITALNQNAALLTLSHDQRVRAKRADKVINHLSSLVACSKFHVVTNVSQRRKRFRPESAINLSESEDRNEEVSFISYFPTLRHLLTVR